MERPINWTEKDFQSFQKKRPGPEAICAGCYGAVGEEKEVNNWCQTLCECLQPHRWVHNACLTKMLAAGHNGDLPFALVCNDCKSSLWGGSGALLDEACRLMNDAIRAKEKHSMQKDIDQLAREYLAQSYELAVDAVGYIVKHSGGGTASNPLMSDALCVVASTMFKMDCDDNANGYPSTDRSGLLCRDAMEMGGYPTLEVARIGCAMVAVCEPEDASRIEQWLDFALNCVQQYKATVPTTLRHKHTSADLIALDVGMHRPALTLSGIREEINRWPWGIDALTVDACLLICNAFALYGEYREMSPYWDRGVELDETLFTGKVKQGREALIQKDLASCMELLERPDANSLQTRALGEFWPWKVTLLPVAVLIPLIGAYYSFQESSVHEGENKDGRRDEYCAALVALDGNRIRLEEIIQRCVHKVQVVNK